MCPSLLPPYRIAPLTSTPIGNRVWPHHFHPLVHVSPTSLPIWSRAPQHFYPHWGRGLLLTSIAIGSGVWPRTSIPMCVCVCVPPLEVGAPPLLSPWSLTPHLYLHESATHFNPRVDSRPSLLSPLGGGGCPSLLSPCGVCAPYGIAPLTHTGIPLLNINAFGRVSRAHNFVVARPPTLNVQGQRCMQPCTY